MATVSKREWIGSDGKAKAAWRVAYTDAGGKRRFKQFKAKKTADAYALTVAVEMHQGVHVADAASITVKEAADIWLGSAEKGGCDRGTLKSYREIVGVHIVPLIGSELLTKLTAPKVVAFRDALLATRSHAMSSKAVRHLSMILGEAMQRGLVGQNVARTVKVRRPRQEDQGLAKRADIPPVEHLKAMLKAADELGEQDPRLPVMVRVVMLAGLRASELRGFAWPCADLRSSQPSLTVSQRADRWNELGPPKSKAGCRTIPIGPALATSLKAWKLRCPPSELNLMFPNRPRGRQWASSIGRTGGGPIKQHTMADLLLKVQVKADIAVDTGKRTAEGAIVWALRYDWHHLRHVAASNWLNDGIDLKRLQVWIGHENIQLTIDVYGHLMADSKKDAALAAGAEAALLA